MDKKLLEELKLALEQKKKSLEKELSSFAKKDPKLEHDWDSRFPKFNGGGVGGQMLEDAADEVEEYVSRLSVEFSLETRLRDVNLALVKIQKKGYGICETCSKKIEVERLRACPEAKLCIQCQKKLGKGK